MKKFFLTLTAVVLFTAASKMVAVRAEEMAAEEPEAAVVEVANETANNEAMNNAEMNAMNEIANEAMNEVMNEEADPAPTVE